MDVPFDALMAYRCLSSGDGEAVYETVVDARHHNPTGRLHGGVLSGLADAAMGAAFLSSLGGAAGTNLDLSIRFLRPVIEGRLEARARTIKAGKTVSLLSCDVFDAHRRLVATAQSQFMRL